MTLEEAIRLLDPETTGEAIAEIEYYNGFSGKTAAIQAITDACEIAVEAMGKQIPKKPIGKVATSPVKIGNGIFREGTTIHHCPNCGGLIPHIYKYCGHCGQALDWSKEKMHEWGEETCDFDEEGWE